MAFLTTGKKTWLWTWLQWSHCWHYYYLTRVGAIFLLLLPSLSRVIIVCVAVSRENCNGWHNCFEAEKSREKKLIYILYSIFFWFQAKNLLLKIASFIVQKKMVFQAKTACSKRGLHSIHCRQRCFASKAFLPFQFVLLFLSLFFREKASFFFHSKKSSIKPPPDILDPWESLEDFSQIYIEKVCS